MKLACLYPVVNLLDEQSTGLVAIRSERGDGVA